MLVVTSGAEFVQHVAVNLLRHGYWFYVAGAIPEGKAPDEVDRKLCRIYGVSRSKHVRYRQRRRGESVVTYIRCGRFFLLMASPGRGPFFIFERGQVHDARRRPVRAFGYSLGVRRGRVSVRMAPEEYRFWTHRLMRMSLADRTALESQFWNLPFEPYKPVRNQILALLRGVNERRRAASLPELSRDCVRWKREILTTVRKNGLPSQ